MFLYCRKDMQSPGVAPDVPLDQAFSLLLMAYNNSWGTREFCMFLIVLCLECQQFQLGHPHRKQLGSLFLPLVLAILFFQSLPIARNKWGQELRVTCQLPPSLSHPGLYSVQYTGITSVQKTWHQSTCHWPLLSPYLWTKPEWALQPFLAEKQGDRLGGAHTHSWCFMLSCKPPPGMLEVTAWWRVKQNYGTAEAPHSLSAGSPSMVCLLTELCLQSLCSKINL